MPVATRSSSRPLASSIIPNSPAKRWRAEPHLPSEHPRGPAEEDLDDIDGTTLHQPPPESSISSGSDSDPDSDSDNPISSVTPINKQSAGFSRTKNPHSNPSPTLRKAPLSLPVKSPRGKGVKISHVEVPASPLDNPDIRLSAPQRAQRMPYQLNPRLMLNALPKLERWSDKILLLWSQYGSSYSRLKRHITNSTVKIKIEESWGDSYLGYKRHFGDRHFINVARALDAFPSIEDLNWSPTGIYQKANLAQLTLDIIYFCNGTRSDSPLDIIDSLFPSPFIPGEDEPLSEDTTRRIFEIGLEIRTQRCIMEMIESGKEKKPESILKDIFYGDIFEDSPLRGWEADGLDETDLPEEFRDRIEERIGNIRETFREDDTAVEISRLKTAFPWSEFVVRVASWVRETTDQINDQLKAQDDCNTAIAKLRSEFEPRAILDRQKTDEISQRTPPLESSPKWSRGLHRGERIFRPPRGREGSPELGSRPSENAAVTIEHEQIPEKVQAASFPETAAPQKNFISRALLRHFRQFIDRTQTTASTTHQQVGEASRHTAPPAATFLDRQKNAERISPIQPSPLGDRGPGRKTKRARSEESEDEESAFETTSRPSKRPRVVTEIRRRSPSRTAADRPQRAVSVASSSGRRLPESLQSRESTPPLEDRPTGGIVQRVRWTIEEDRQLIRLVGKYGSSWSRIKAADSNEENPKLENRNQVQLKDRGRQITFDYLRTRQKLPKNFKRINITKPQRKRLEEIGVDPDKREE
ncbi:hypothetical protein D8B26_005211 [Coccidioides posadasii str. Silveira]|uniref:Uncharacterized protein n=1 Tax=Coccidioides posadasii (strain RMSCC 757 / Silveira) TaxID=443226 RepID=E9D684_COCPS|nr:conserved hypothetical protein [Coccidioides posadasii str. Silveira]QVM10553.1 hypothetical protein D8B26_005211 [Coccidioides posadasii str. Silveira]